MKYKVIAIYEDGTYRELQAIPPHDSWDSAMDHAQHGINAKGISRIQVLEISEIIMKKEIIK